MPRRYPDRRRHRTGRRPPNRYRGQAGPPRPGGFTRAGLGTCYRLMMPGLRGPEKKAFFNAVSSWLVAGVALGGAATGLAWLGPLGAVLGLGGGLMAGGTLARRQRFYRR